MRQSSRDRLPSRNAKRGIRRKGEVGESGSKLGSGTDEGRTQRDERGSSVAIACVMLPVSLLLLPFLFCLAVAVVATAAAAIAVKFRVAVCGTSGVAEFGSPTRRLLILGSGRACNTVHDSSFDRDGYHSGCWRLWLLQIPQKSDRNKISP